MSDTEEAVVAVAEEMEAQDGTSTPLQLQLGEKFRSHEHFVARLKEHQKATFTEFSHSDSRLLSWYLKPGRDPSKVAHVNPDIKYMFFSMSCVRAAKKRQHRNNKNMRNKPSHKIECPAFFSVKLTKDGKALYVYKMVSKHNHSTTPDSLVKPRAKAVLKMKVVHHNGFLYRRSVSKKNGTCRLVCLMQKCKGEATENDNDEITLVEPHNHDRSDESKRLEYCIEDMEHRARTETTSAEQILSESSDRYPETINRDNEKFLLEKLKKAKDASEPEVPDNLLQLSRMLVSDSHMHRYGCNFEDFPRELFIGCIQAKENETAATFASLFLCERFNGPVSEMHIDCSFTEFPNVPGDMTHLLSIHFVKDKMFYPSVFAFMSSNSRSMVEGVLRYIQQEVLTNTAPDVIFLDCTWDIQLILSDCFPGSLIENSSFYFGQDVWKEAREIGLFGIFEQESSVPWVQELTCLPFLPPDKIELGLTEFEESFPENCSSKPFFMTIIHHIRRTWINQIGPINLTILDSHARSNLLVHQFHLQLRASLPEKNPTVWHLINGIQKLEMQAAKCYSRDINEETTDFTVMGNLCQIAYDEKVKQIEYALLTDSMNPITALRYLAKRPFVKSLTPDMSKYEFVIPVATEEEV